MEKGQFFLVAQAGGVKKIPPERDKFLFQLHFFRAHHLFLFIGLYTAGSETEYRVQRATLPHGRDKHQHSSSYEIAIIFATGDLHPIQRYQYQSYRQPDNPVDFSYIV